MPGPRLPEPYSVDYLRKAVKDSLSYLGEQAILLQMYHVVPDEGVAERCPNYDDVYQNCARGLCPDCYGTTFAGGVKTVGRVWAQFTDSDANENIDRTGVWAPDAREIQTEWFPPLTQRDYVVRIPKDAWSQDRRTPSAVMGIYRIGVVTQSSLRQGQQLGQTANDLYGQKGSIDLVIDTMPIYQYPIAGKAFERFDGRLW
jgi:hypothetical protein